MLVIDTGESSLYSSSHISIHVGLGHACFIAVLHNRCTGAMRYNLLKWSDEHVYRATSTANSVDAMLPQ